jgi:hypothetical protein
MVSFGKDVSADSRRIAPSVAEKFYGKKITLCPEKARDLLGIMIFRFSA